METSQLHAKPRTRQAVIAILAMHDDLKPFRGNSQNFVDLIDTGHQHGVQIYVVTPRDLKMKRRTINGYTYDKQTGTWVRKQIARPSVIYNRLPYRKDELDPEVQEVIRQCMEHPRIRFYNPSFFNKWQLIEWLRQSQKTSKLIPHTVQWGPNIKLSPLFSRSPLLYLKPESGKAGKGIMQVRRRGGSEASYRLSVQTGKSAARYRFRSIRKLRAKLQELIGSEPYIVQQGILLPRYKKRPFDLRVLVQKNEKGVWSLTGIGARLAGSKSITTHVPRGGTIDDPFKLLSAAYGDEEAARILSRVSKAAVAIARQIEASNRSLIGEMSMDIGVDANGSPWFFEANSKPMKFDEPHIRAKSLENTVLYCKYLASKARGKSKVTKN